MSTCTKAEALRDFAFDELAATDRRAMERHIAGCTDCAADLTELRLTTAALRVLPDQDIPQRIAFVSDKVFSPSPVARFFGGIWNSAARLGFASACVIAAALLISAWHRPAAPVEVAARMPDVSGMVAQKVAQEVSSAVARIRSEDAQLTKTALDLAERRHEREHRMLLVSMQENLDVMQKRLRTYTTLASAELPRNGEGQ
jgi:anti-sigma factor RsiW